MRAIRALAPGGPDVLHLDELPDPEPGPGQVVVAVVAAGVNFIDVYRRTGRYAMPFPHVVGAEGAGTVRAVGAGVDLPLGTPVAWADGSSGSYTDLAVVAADRLVPVPADVPLETAAALMLQGLTAHYLSHSTAPILPGQDVLVHAGAGGVGLLLTQLAVLRGAQVLTTVSTAEKEELSRAAGASEVLRYDQLDDLPKQLPAWVHERTDGGVHSVFDGVGRTTFDASLASLRRRGTLALFGGASGPVPPVDPMRLQDAGSVFLTRPTLGHHIADRAELLARSGDLLTAIAGGHLDVRVGQRFALDGAAEAHRALEGRRTTGKVLLLV